MASQFNNLPLYNVPLLQAGQILRDWYFFFSGLFRGLPPGNVEAVTVGTSPYTYSAARRGFLILTGGTVSSVEFSRDGTTFYDYGTTAGQFAVSAADQVRITHTGAPDTVFVPT